MHLKEYEWPNIAVILRGDAQPGDTGVSALSYRPAAEVISLPRPVSDRKAGQAILDALKVYLDRADENQNNHG